MNPPMVTREEGDGKSKRQKAKGLSALCLLIGWAAYSFAKAGRGRLETQTFL